MAAPGDARLDLVQAGWPGAWPDHHLGIPGKGAALRLFALFVATAIKRLARGGLGGCQDLGLFLFRLLGLAVTVVLFLGHGDAPAGWSARGTMPRTGQRLAGRSGLPAVAGR